jgi:hypothetical protein
MQHWDWIPRAVLVRSLCSYSHHRVEAITNDDPPGSGLSIAKANRDVRARPEAREHWRESLRDRRVRVRW